MVQASFVAAEMINAFITSTEYRERFGHHPSSANRSGALLNIARIDVTNAWGVDKSCR
jgi:hypothetical protein